RRPLRMFPACSINRRAARSSSLPKYGWIFMVLSLRPKIRKATLYHAYGVVEEKQGFHSGGFRSAGETARLCQIALAGGARRGKKAEQIQRLAVYPEEAGRRGAQGRAERHRGAAARRRADHGAHAAAREALARNGGLLQEMRGEARLRAERAA